jgi:hypothetical protein
VRQESGLPERAILFWFVRGGAMMIHVLGVVAATDIDTEEVFDFLRHLAVGQLAIGREWKAAEDALLVFAVES